MERQHIDEVSRTLLVERYRDVLSMDGKLPSVAALRRCVLAQHQGNTSLQAIGMLLCARYDEIYSLFDTCANAFARATYVDELDEMATGIRQADVLAARVLAELESNGFRVCT